MMPQVDYKMDLYEETKLEIIINWFFVLLESSMFQYTTKYVRRWIEERSEKNED